MIQTHSVTKYFFGLLSAALTHIHGLLLLLYLQKYTQSGYNVFIERPYDINSEIPQLWLSSLLYVTSIEQCWLSFIIFDKH